MVSLKFLFDEAMKKHRSEWCSDGQNNVNRRTKNKTGFKWLCRVKINHPRGYHWVYHRRVDNEHISIYGADLFRLFDKVIERGFDWIVLDEERAMITVKNEGIQWEDYVDYMKSHGGFKQLVVNENGNWFKEVQ
ncbi:MAG: hypothetical protein IJF83_05730 [Methanobrevibacter sp.]|nr:hypothetical protein [Methanobrevibacter sp.]